jgi:hypothetical protein
METMCAFFIFYMMNVRVVYIINLLVTCQVDLQSEPVDCRESSIMRVSVR